MTDKQYSAFFYGTLMRPLVLKWAIDNDGTHLNVCPALLPDHTRHEVEGRGFPGLLPYSESKSMIGIELGPQERSVHGLLVLGLKESEMDALDEFEDVGVSYKRENVSVRPLGPIISFPSYESASSEPASEGEEAPGEPIECITYVWMGEVEELKKELWVPT